MAPKRKAPEIPSFQVGTTVEVSSDEEGFRGSWYLGTIVRRPTSKTPNKYLVQYKELIDDSIKEKKPLTELVHWVLLRPEAPREKNRRFKVDDEVDGYHDDGWWEGFVTEEIGDDGKKFLVYFRYSKEELLLRADQLRLHREWVDGKWIPPLEDDENMQVAVEENLDTSGNQEKSELQGGSSSAEVPKRVAFSDGMLVEVNTDGRGSKGAWFAARVIEDLRNDTYLVEYQKLKTEYGTGNLRRVANAFSLRPVPPEAVVLDSFKTLDEVDASYNDGWHAGVIAEVLHDSKLLITLKHTNKQIEFKNSEVRLHQDWIHGKWTFPS